MKESVQGKLELFKTPENPHEKELLSMLARVYRHRTESQKLSVLVLWVCCVLVFSGLLCAHTGQHCFLSKEEHTPTALTVWPCLNQVHQSISLTYSFCPSHSEIQGVLTFLHLFCLTGAKKLLWVLALPASSHLLNFRPQVTFWSKVYERKYQNKKKGEKKKEFLLFN